MRRARLISAFLAVIVACCTMTACFGMPQDPVVAADVNGDSVYEDEVTEYIEGFRSKNKSYETDQGWAEFLVENSYTPETIREKVISETFIPKLLIRQECAKRDITLSDEHLDEVIENEKAYYEKRYGENSWDSVLASFGYTEETWRENESDRLLEEQLVSEVVKDDKPTDKEVLKKLEDSSANYEGKHSYVRSFESEHEANAALSKLKLKKGNKTTLKNFRKKMQHVVSSGWSSLSEDREDMSQEYVNALDSLKKDQVSGVISSGDKYLVIFCDDVFKVKDDGSTRLSDVPSQILDQVREDARSKKSESIFDKWLKGILNKSDIDIKEMPSDLPYDVNVAIGE